MALPQRGSLRLKACSDCFDSQVLTALMYWFVQSAWLSVLQSSCLAVSHMQG
jgi:hypothetical protein